MTSKPKTWLLMVLIGFPQLSETLYAPALPNIAHALNASNALAQWTLSIYFIGFATGVFYWGRLSDHIGRRRSMLISLLVYTFGSLCCLAATSIQWLLLSRIIQGFGASSGSVLTQIIAREALNERSRHRFFSSAGFVIAFSIAIGPFIGGYTNEWFGWRANFMILMLIGLIVSAITYLKLPETLKPNYVDIQPKTMEVLKRMLKDKYIWGSIWLVGAVNGLLFSYYAESPFIFMKIVGLSPGTYGWLGIFIAAGALIGSIFSIFLGKFLTRDAIIRTGGICMLAGTILLLSFSYFGIVQYHAFISSILAIMLPMMLIMFGSFGLIIPAILSNALLQYKDVLGTAGAFFGLAYYILIAILTAIMGTIHNGSITPMPIYFIVLAISVLLVYSGLANRPYNRAPKGQSILSP